MERGIRHGGGNKEGIESVKRRETKGTCGRETRRSGEKMRGDFSGAPSDPSDVRGENLSPPSSAHPTPHLCVTQTQLRN